MKTLKKSEIINKLHVLIYLYLTFGWIFSDMSCKILLLFSPTVMTQWGVNNDKCILTQIVNKKCYPEFTEYKKFNDFSHMLGLQDNYPKISYYYLIFIILYDIHKIMKYTEIIGDSVR